METKRVNKPWGYELIFAVTEKYVGKILHINKGESLSLQYHKIKDETIHVQSGLLLFQTAPPHQPEKMTEMELKPGQSFRITPLLIHRMVALQDTDVLEVSTPELDDVVRL
jgi:mannose-6-phosphate isomerase-like protein (cupin superfamily)